MSIIFFHKILCRCLMIDRSSVVKGGGVHRLTPAMCLFVICHDSTGIFSLFLADRWIDFVGENINSRLPFVSCIVLKITQVNITGSNLLYVVLN